uniref:Uncharacterized protein n=1 Tax=Acrobeloides nanus TaxID=290746 RepID=A0A914C060_9BILA
MYKFTFVILLIVLSYGVCEDYAKINACSNALIACSKFCNGQEITCKQKCASEFAVKICGGMSLFLYGDSIKNWLN